MALPDKKVLADLYRKRAGQYDFSLFAPLFIFLTKPFGVTKELSARHPYESIQKYLKNSSVAELYMGFVYIATGERGKNY